VNRDAPRAFRFFLPAATVDGVSSPRYTRPRTIADDEIHVWLAPTDVPPTGLDRARSIIARSTLRQILGRNLARGARAFRFVGGKHATFADTAPGGHGGRRKVTVVREGEGVSVRCGDARERALRAVVSIAVDTEGLGECGEASGGVVAEGENRSIRTGDAGELFVVIPVVGGLRCRHVRYRWRRVAVQCVYGTRRGVIEVTLPAASYVKEPSV
jgi:hypothetical protein